MKKKPSVVLLFAGGAIILCVSIILAIIATGTKNVIGGADFPTFWFVFFFEKRGLYVTLAFLGVAAIIASVVGMVKRKQGISKF